jgi:hypothetical protein
MTPPNKARAISVLGKNSTCVTGKRPVFKNPPPTRFFWGPKWHSPAARSHLTGLKKVSISRAHHPPTCPRNGVAHIKSITYGAALIIGPGSINTVARLAQECDLKKLNLRSLLDMSVVHRSIVFV